MNFTHNKNSIKKQTISSQTMNKPKLQKKILYWGIGGSGKTTIVNTFYKLTKEQKKGVRPIGNLTRIEKASGATLYFDRGIFQSIKQEEMFYHVYTVAGQKSFYPLRKKVFQGTNGVIFVFDSQTKCNEDNIESLRELKNITEKKLIVEIPLIIMANKQDLNDVIGKDEILQILKEEKLWYEIDDKLSLWNPIIYETCALYDQQKDIYRSFSECARRVEMYHSYGKGKAPIDNDLKK